MEELKHFQDAGVVNKLPTGAIIGKVNLVDCFQIDEAYRRKLQRENPAELAFGDYTIGRYAWVMADAILFNKPIPAKGKQGLWNWKEMYRMNDDEKCCCGNCLHHRPSWETGHLSGWHCDNFMADAYGCDTEYDDGEECPDFESKR
jgi:hypothetical protein